jgi:ABC-type phosphate transport system substrate-binding protein
VLIVVAMFVGVSATRSAAARRSVNVSPAADLANEVVRVRWSGFTPTEADGDFAVVVMQCPARPAALEDCFAAEPYPQIQEGTRILGRTDADGTGAALFEVRPAANLPQLDCSQTKPCSLVVYENDGVPVPPGSLPPSAVVAPLRFAKSQSDCPPVAGFDLRAEGEASAAPLFYSWAAQRCSGRDALVLDYTETSSNSGREDFLAGLVDLGVTTLPATSEELESHPGHPAFAYAPVDLTAVTVVVNMRDPGSGRRIDDLVLSPRLVARLVTDSDLDTFLIDPELRRLNPGVRFPSGGLAAPLLRAERNADTRLLTSWMVSTKAARDFVADRDQFRPPVRVNGAYRSKTYPVDTFENVANSAAYLPRTGQRSIALRMFYGVRPTGSSTERTDLVGFIGIVDLPAARRFGLPTARLVNAAGRAVSPSTESIKAGYEAMKRTAAGTLVANFASKDPKAYPLVKVDYAMVPTRLKVGAKGADLREILAYIATDGQRELPSGYLALPDELRAEVLAVAAEVDYPGAPKAITTTTATSSTTTTVATRDGFSTYVPDTSDTGSAIVGTGSSASGDGTGTADRGPTGAGRGDRGRDATALPISVLGDSRSRLALPGMLALGGLALLAWSLSGASKAWQKRRVTAGSAA